MDDVTTETSRQVRITPRLVWTFMTLSAAGLLAMSAYRAVTAAFAAQRTTIC